MLLSVMVIGLFLVGSVSSYYCINVQEDNEGVIDFKNKVNIIAMKEDIITHGLTYEAFNLKLKYFGPCN